MRSHPSAGELLGLDAEVGRVNPSTSQRGSSATLLPPALDGSFKEPAHLATISASIWTWLAKGEASKHLGHFLNQALSQGESTLGAHLALLSCTDPRADTGDEEGHLLPLPAGCIDEVKK